MFRTCTYILILFIATSLFAANWFARKKELKQLPSEELVSIIIVHEKCIIGYQDEIEKRDKKIRRLEIRVARSFGMRFVIGLIIAGVASIVVIVLLLTFKDAIKKISLP